MTQIADVQIHAVAGPTGIKHWAVAPSEDLVEALAQRIFDEKGCYGDVVLVKTKESLCEVGDFTPRGRLLKRLDTYLILGFDMIPNGDEWFLVRDEVGPLLLGSEYDYSERGMEVPAEPRLRVDGLSTESIEATIARELLKGALVAG